MDTPDTLLAAALSDAADAHPQAKAARPIGALLAETRRLSADQLDRIADFQRDHGGRFGEAAIALGCASVDDVLQALGQQFGYPCGTQSAQLHSEELVMLTQPHGAQAEALRAIRSRLNRLQGHDTATRKACAVISADRGDGRSYFAANLAIAYAQQGARTLLVDADLRTPRLHQLLGVANRSGLSSMLVSRARADAAVQAVPGVAQLWVLTAGPTPPNPVELLDRPAFEQLMQLCADSYDQVIVDTPAASRGSDASVIASRCGRALVVARRHRTRIPDLDALVQPLESSVAFAGLVVNEG